MVEAPPEAIKGAYGVGYMGAQPDGGLMGQLIESLNRETKALRGLG